MFECCCFRHLVGVFFFIVPRHSVDKLACACQLKWVFIERVFFMIYLGLRLSLLFLLYFLHFDFCIFIYTQSKTEIVHSEMKTSKKNRNGWDQTHCKPSKRSLASFRTRFHIFPASQTNPNALAKSLSNISFSTVSFGCNPTNWSRYAISSFRCRAYELSYGLCVELT